MANIRIGGAGIGLNLTGALASQLPQGTSFAPAKGSNVVTLSASECFMFPAGTYQVCAGSYTSLQFLDPVAGMWRTINAENSLSPIYVDADGGNWRLANLTGTPVGALITNAGTGYTNGIGTTATGCTITVSSGASVWVPVVGGACNSTITITAAGSGYLYPPVLVFDAPPVGGVQASGVCTISAGAINAVTVTNQGAGYTTKPNITLINDQRDAVGAGGILTVNSTLAGSGTLTAMYPSNQGTVLTSVPTFTFSPASSTAATAVMNFVITGITISAGLSGTGYKTSQPFLVLTQGGIVAGTRATDVAGPIADRGLTQPRLAMIAGLSSTTNAATATNAVVVDAGFGFQAVPNAVIIASGTAIPTVNSRPTFTVGGITDTSYVQPV